jgi:Fe-S cluster assembly protein SufD
MALTSAAAETQFAEQFRELIKRETKSDLRELRQRAFASFTERGFPTPREEDWKYTDLTRLARGSWTAPPLFGEPAWWGSYGDIFKDFDFQRNGLTALNLAFAPSISVSVIPKDMSFSQTQDLMFSSASGMMMSPHNLLIAEPGSKATIVESYAGSGFTNSVTRIIVGDNADITHYRVQKDSAEGYNYGSTEVTLGWGSRYDSTNINLGSALSRHDVNVRFSAEGAEAFVDGLYMLNGSQHHDTHSVIDHLVPNCTSHQTYRGVLNDHSRGVFNGKVFVRENAHGTDAQQSNKNLLLSNNARVDTKPQLEIFNDDVKCSHGATVGQLEEEELFYLLTRGLPENLARNLLTYGFAEQIINKINVEAIKKDLDEAVLTRLDALLMDSH